MATVVDLRGRDIRIKREGVPGEKTFSQRELGKLVGISEGTIIDLEKERAHDAALLRRLDAALDRLITERTSVAA